MRAPLRTHMCLLSEPSPSVRRWTRDWGSCWHSLPGGTCTEARLVGETELPRPNSEGGHGVCAPPKAIPLPLSGCRLENWEEVVGREGSSSSPAPPTPGHPDQWGEHQRACGSSPHQSDTRSWAGQLLALSKGPALLGTGFSNNVTTPSLFLNPWARRWEKRGLAFNSAPSPPSLPLPPLP